MALQIDMLSLPAGASTATAAAVAVAALPSAGVLRPSVPAPSPDASRSQAPPGTEAVKSAARQINEFLRASSANIEFSVDDRTRQVVVRVLDPQTNELIRQVPSEEVLAIAESLDRMSGLLLRQTA